MQFPTTALKFAVWDCRLKECLTLASTVKSNRGKLSGSLLLDGYAVVMSPNKNETAVQGCNCLGDVAVPMRQVLARPWVV